MKLKFFILGLLLSCAQILTAQSNEVLTNKTVTDLVKAGLDNSIIVSKINSSTCNFDVSTNSLLALKKSGVAAEVIKAMVDKSAAKQEVPELHKKVNGVTEQLKNLNFVYAVQSGDLVTPLEKALANQKTKSKPWTFGYGGANGVLQIDGAKSDVRFDASQPLSFLIKTGTEVAPQLILYKLTTSGKKREATLQKIRMTGVQGSQGGILLNVSKEDDGVYKLTPAATLAKGEYFLVNRDVSNGGTNSEVYAFGID